MNIKELKEKDGRGYREIARAAELSVSAVWRVVNGKRKRISIQTVVKLAAVFGVTTQEVIDAIEEVK
jgi:transcriptional regulator with XRE-family HTH domain